MKCWIWWLWHTLTLFFKRFFDGSGNSSEKCEIVANCLGQPMPLCPTLPFVQPWSSQDFCTEPLVQCIETEVRPGGRVGNKTWTASPSSWSFFVSGNVHRGMHTLSMRSTEAFEGARKKVADFVNAPDVHEPWLRVGPRWSLDVKTLRNFGWWRCRTGLLTGNSIKKSWLNWIH